MNDGTTEKLTEFFPLSKSQRRVLGVLIEKAFTTPEYYPLTLKALTAGCNQKSNRDPVLNYSEEAVEDTIEQLRELGLAATVHTEGGRAARYRHYMRHRFEITEPELAVITELMLRGRQQLGELRSRAARMVPLDSLDELREAVGGLIAKRAAQASGDLSRRGVEVDHRLYEPRENVPPFAASSGHDEPPARPAAAVPATPVPDASPVPAANDDRIEELERQLRESLQSQRQLLEDVDRLKEELESLQRDFEDFRTQLGG
jgi:uncharacterized protein